MERNRDKIKRLEHELGRYQKKVADDAVLLNKLHKELEQAYSGNQETQAMVDAILTAVVLHCGEDAVDPDDESRVLGKRITLPRFSVKDIRAGWEIRARKDGDDYVLGVVPKAEEAEDGGKAFRGSRDTGDKTWD